MLKNDVDETFIFSCCCQIVSTIRSRCYHADNMHPSSSDKIRAKILDLGYGGAGRALCNLGTKSARILSVAISNDDSAPRRG